MSLVPTTFRRGRRPAPFASEADGPSGPDADAVSTARHLLGSPRVSVRGGNTNGALGSTELHRVSLDAPS
jgi:hypothetical protein